jgi:death on curing protein
MVRYLAVEELVVVNQVVIEETGGMYRIREYRLLESISIKPQTQFTGSDLYPDIFLKAAVLYEALVNYHVFIDGNKRTGFAAMARFLYINGYYLDLSEREIVDYTLNVAMQKIDLADITTWLKAHSMRTRT